jgi:hypothetical protein
MYISPRGVVMGAFVDLLARPVGIGAVFEVEGDVGQGIFGGRAQHLLLGDAQHFLLDGHGDAGFDLFWRHARGLQDELDLGARDVGEGVDGEVQPGKDAACGQHGHEQHDQHTLAQGEFNEAIEHG